MTISEKVAYLKGLAEGLNIDTEKSKEGKLISVMIGILEEVGLSIEDLEENALALGEEIDTISDDLADVESVVYGEDEDEDHHIVPPGVISPVKKLEHGIEAGNDGAEKADNQHAAQPVAVFARLEIGDGARAAEYRQPG